LNVALSNLPRIEKLHRSHDVEPFDCGQAALNRFLIRHALQNQQSSAATTYVALVEQEVVGFYSLAYGQIEYADAPERLAKGLARYPVPIMLLARLAVDARWQGKGLGAGMLRDAVSRTLQAADIAGLRALAAHAKDDKARAFYQHFNFIPSPTDSYHMAIVLKDIRIILQG
jgi:GNAT superfamily N-acetyltransferase